MNGKVGTFYGPDVEATVVEMGTTGWSVVLKGLMFFSFTIIYFMM